MNLVGSLVAFIPMGFLLPAVFKKVNTLLKCVGVTFAVTASIEIAQLIFQVGIFDIDDFILNIPGAICGYGLFSIKPIKNFILINH